MAVRVRAANERETRVMLIVTVELINANNGERSTLGVAEIYNDGTGDWDTGNYVCKIYHEGEGRRVWKAGAVEGFPRRRLGPWDLLYRALREVVGPRNGVSR
jgi:hypothetical protein